MFFGDFLFWGDTTWLIIIPALLISLYAQIKVQSAFAKYSQNEYTASSGYTGASLVRKILDDHHLSHISVEETPQALGDHYDPRELVIRLSPKVYRSSTLAALGVAAHEVGHALQYHEDYVPVKLRSVMVPVTNISTQLSWILFFVGFIFSWGLLLNIGILLFCVAVVFTLVTLPVEFNASHRALYVLENGGFLTAEETRGAKKVLSAAAMTYVAAALMAIMQLLRLILLSRRRD